MNALDFVRMVSTFAEKNADGLDLDCFAVVCSVEGVVEAKVVSYYGRIDASELGREVVSAITSHLVRKSVIG